MPVALLVVMAVGLNSQKYSAMIKVCVSRLYGVRSLYATMPRRLFDTLEAAALSGQDVAVVHASDLLEVFAPASGC